LKHVDITDVFNPKSILTYYDPVAKQVIWQKTYSTGGSDFAVWNDNLYMGGSRYKLTGNPTGAADPTDGSVGGWLGCAATIKSVADGVIVASTDALYSATTGAYISNISLPWDTHVINGKGKVFGGGVAKTLISVATGSVTNTGIFSQNWCGPSRGTSTMVFGQSGRP